MKTTAHLLEPRPGRCCVAAVRGGTVELRDLPCSGEQDRLPQRGTLSEALQEPGFHPQRICLGLPSDMVLAAGIETGGLPRKHRRSAMIYQLEEQLPVDAEQITVGFLPAVRGRALGLAVKTEEVSRIIDALAKEGIETAAVRPTALLALAGLLDGQVATARYALLAGEDQVEVFRLEDGRPTAWFTVDHSSDALVRCLDADVLSSPPETGLLRANLVGPIQGGLAEAICQRTGIAVEHLSEEPVLALAARSAGAALEGRLCEWGDLRRDALAARNPWSRFAGPVKSALALAVLLTVALTAMFYWRAGQYESAVRAHEGRQAALFRQVFPNRPAPVSVKSRLASERKRLSATSGTETALPLRACALETLRRVAAALPGQVRLRIDELRVGPDSVILDGTTRSHGDAEAVATALRRAGLSAGSPRTEKLADRGVRFTMVADLRPSGASAARRAQ